MNYITIYNIIGIIFAILALVTSFIYYTTKNKGFLLVTALSQSFFLLEILNIKLHKSNSRYKPTVLQLFYRMFNIWVIYFFYECTSEYFPVVMTSWYFTDIVRYLYYIFREKYIKVVRYNLFIFLYPISIYIEMKSMFCVLIHLKGMLGIWFCL